MVMVKQARAKHKAITHADTQTGTHANRHTHTHTHTHADTYHWVLAKPGVNLAKLDAEPPDLDLVICAAHDLHGAVGAEAAEIARAVQAVALQRAQLGCQTGGGRKGGGSKRRSAQVHRYTGTQVHRHTDTTRNTTHNTHTSKQEVDIVTRAKVRRRLVLCNKIVHTQRQ